MKKETVLRDGKLNFKCFYNKLHKSSSFQLAMDCVLVTMSGGARVWLAGHSPGSAMALLAGKNMAKMGYFLETYLFNPPFLYFPMEAAIKDTIVKFVIRCAGSVVSAGLSRDVNGCQHHETEDHESFNVPLSSWIPYLFVNPHYPICSEYIGYFEQRKKMRAKILGGVDRFLTKSCMDSGSEPLNLIPSADLTINRCQLTEFQGPFCKYKKFKRAHGIQQWWNYVPYDSLRYEYNTTNYVE
ncbi:GDSL esterase/lipase At4g10955-like [Quercus lobata]|uniref:GDSL esterase/lipase At4g10955-like n=1 Tax=Quercus lobata TaxID=97700 RepID=UPI0012475839|nr:GDSL esterase/lipase At4g10955-like [Quercus lobata]